MTTAQLPNDIDALKSLIIEQHERLHAQHDQMHAERDQLKEKIAELEAQLAYMKRMLFGRRSEKIDRNQLLLFNEIQKQLEDARAGDRSALESARAQVAAGPRTRGLGAGTAERTVAAPAAKHGRDRRLGARRDRHRHRVKGQGALNVLLMRPQVAGSTGVVPATASTT